MLKHILNRLGTSAILIVLLTAMIFFAGRGLVPGSLASQIVGPKASPAAVAAVEHELGLDRPVYVQYFDWLLHALKGDFGTSPITGLSTTQVLAQQTPISLELALFALLIAVVIGVPLGVLAATRANTAVDSAVRAPMIFLFAVPGFIMGSLFVYFAGTFLTDFYSPVYIPFRQDPIQNLRMMVLPAFAVGIPTAPLIMQMTRGAMIETLGQPFVVAARCNGLSSRMVTYGYALRAALPPILTFVGFMFGTLIGGLVIVEQIFNLPGLGRGILQSIANRDFVQLVAQAAILATSFIGANLTVDLVIPFLDRRIGRQ
jgi:peptide/nickel transport system permease protein